MKIGITYDLREEYLGQGYSEEETVEFDKAETIDDIESCLQSLHFETERIGNLYHLIAKLTSGAKWDLVFNIAEGLYGMGREAQIPAILDAYNIPYTFSDPLVLALTLHKGLTKRIVRDLKIATPDFQIVESEIDLNQCKLPFPLFAKPIAEGTSKGITAASKINNPTELKNTCLDLLAKYHQPVLVEEYLPGREFTVGVIGNREEAKAIGVLEILLKDQAEKGVYSYHNKENYHSLVEYRLIKDELAQQCAEVALRVWHGLGCRDAGRVDLRMNQSGEINFIEVNPLAGLSAAHSDLPIMARLAGITYPQLIEMITNAALKRIFPTMNFC